MKGGKNRQPLTPHSRGGQRPGAGYTIVEVMIVLAISATMFLIAANFINGKQERTAFNEGLNNMASQIQDITEQVNDGKFSDVPLNCQFISNSVTLGGAANPQGTNSQCVFLGKLLRFQAGGVASNYDVLSLAAGRIDPNVEAPTLTNTDPTEVPSLTINQTIDQNLDVTGMSVTNTAGSTYTNTYYNFGFTQGLGVANGKGSFQSGAQTISLVYSPVTASEPDGDVNGKILTAQSVKLCLNDGKQTGSVTIGTNNNQLSVTVQHLGTGNVACP